MRVRSGAAVSLVPIAVSTALLTFCVAGARFYASSAGSASFADQIDETCRSASALTLPLPAVPDAEEQIAALAADVPHLDPSTRGDVAQALLLNEGGPPRRMTVLHLEDVEQHVEPALSPLGPDEIAVSRTSLRELAAQIGDEFPLLTGGSLRIAQVFDDIPSSPIPDYWCGWPQLFEPTRGGDPPPPSAIASTDTIARLGAFSYREFRVTRERLTLSEARDTATAVEAATDEWDRRFAEENGALELNEITRVVARASAVADSVERTLAPVLLTAVVATAAVLAAAAVLLARARRRELRLLAVRGLPPWRIAGTIVGQVAVALSVGAVVGTACAYAAVRFVGPSPVLEPDAVVRGVVTAALATVIAVPLISLLIARVADQWVDGTRRRVTGRLATALVVAALVALAVVAFRRLDRDGGIRTFGVEARGGSLLSLGFPLFGLLAAVAVVALAIVATTGPLRLSGARMPRWLRLGWRRVVLEPAPLGAIVAAIALAAGCLTTSSALADAARRQLADKADVYVGSDLAVTIYDEPTVDWIDRTTVLTTARGRMNGGSFDLVGIDPSTFASIARMRSDTSDRSLAELVELVTTPPGDAPAPAIAVGTDAEVGDDVELSVPGGDAPATVRVVATLDWFPGKSSGAEMYVVDRSVVDATTRFPIHVLLVRDPPDDAIAQLLAAGVRTGLVRDVDTAFDGSAYRALQWAYAPLAVLGALFAVVALALQLLVVAARSTGRRATHAVMRRTGFRPRHLFGASAVETAVPLVVGCLIGVVAAAMATRIAVPRLDPMPSLQPPSRAAAPWLTIAAIAATVPVWTALLAAGITRSTVHADPLEVLHGEL